MSVLSNIELIIELPLGNLTHIKLWNLLLLLKPTPAPGTQVAINWCMAKGTVPIPGAKDLVQVRKEYI